MNGYNYPRKKGTTITTEKFVVALLLLLILGGVSRLVKI